MGAPVRRLTFFECEGARLAASLDEGHASTGLLIVSGGSEIRSGAHGGMAALAARVAGKGFAAFRYDRRGIGDSDGMDRGFSESLPDMAAAAAAFRALCPGLARIVAFGNCDAATALALHHRAAGIDALILANPWVVEPSQGLPPPAAIRRRYREKLFSVAGWKQLLTLQFDLSKIIKGLRGAAAGGHKELAARMAASLDGGTAPLTVVLAEGDATAIAFEDAWKRAMFDNARARAHVFRVPTRSHSFAKSEDEERLTGAVLEALARQ